ncbi:MAG: SRPBCC domain-containing protein [Gemmatimonadota bacterium]
MMGETSTVKVSRRVEAGLERVFRAWTDPAQMKQWACPEHAVVEEASVDLRVGGGYEIRMRGDEERYTAYGTYRVVHRPHRLVYTWDWREEAHRMGETLVTVEFVASGEGTEVTVTHERFPSVEARDGHQFGWTSCLDRFERLLAPSRAGAAGTGG